ncbi:MAG: phage integrase N-terminal SAM-like domain-containing protein [Acidobacteria bacterium]|nr:phage integrase N-terminal SAM-like domain-containing protein [Acidobacteriota bacterium]
MANTKTREDSVGSCEPEAGKPKLMVRLRQALRARHYSQSTETLYCYWVRRYCRFHKLRHPNDRITMLPEIVREPLRRHLERVRRVHRRI